jgi:hypothetical protein
MGLNGKTSKISLYGKFYPKGYKVSKLFACRISSWLKWRKIMSD